MSSMKKILIDDMSMVESYLERETYSEHTESPLIFGILRVLYHLLTAEIRRMEAAERSKK